MSAGQGPSSLSARWQTSSKIGGGAPTLAVGVPEFSENGVRGVSENGVRGVSRLAVAREVDAEEEDGVYWRRS